MCVANEPNLRLVGSTNSKNALSYGLCDGTLQTDRGRPTTTKRQQVTTSLSAQGDRVSCGPEVAAWKSNCDDGDGGDCNTVTRSQLEPMHVDCYKCGYCRLLRCCCCCCNICNMGGCYTTLAHAHCATGTYYLAGWLVGNGARWMFVVNL